MTSKTKKTKKPREMPEYICPICSKKIRGNGYARHEASCRRKADLGGNTTKLYPVPLSTPRYEAFAAWCAGEGLTLAEGVDKLITEKVG